MLRKVKLRTVSTQWMNFSSRQSSLSLVCSSDSHLDLTHLDSLEICLLVYLQLYSQILVVVRILFTVLVVECKEESMGTVLMKSMVFYLSSQNEHFIGTWCLCSCFIMHPKQTNRLCVLSDSMDLSLTLPFYRFTNIIKFQVCKRFWSIICNYHHKKLYFLDWVCIKNIFE